MLVSSLTEVQILKLRAKWVDVKKALRWNLEFSSNRQIQNPIDTMSIKSSVLPVPSNERGRCPNLMDSKCMKLSEALHRLSLCLVEKVFYLRITR